MKKSKHLHNLRKKNYCRCCRLGIHYRWLRHKRFKENGLLLNEVVDIADVPGRHRLFFEHTWLNGKIVSEKIVQ